MVYHSKPQGLGSRSLIVNANNPPQGFGGSTTPPPVGDDELIEEIVGVFDHCLFDSGSGDTGFVLIQET